MLYQSDFDSTMKNLNEATKKFKDAKMSIAASVVGPMLGIPPQVSSQLAGLMGGINASGMSGSNLLSGLGGGGNMFDKYRTMMLNNRMR